MHYKHEPMHSKMGPVWQNQSREL